MCKIKRNLNEGVLSMSNLPLLNPHFKLIADAVFSGRESGDFPKQIRRDMQTAAEACYQDHDMSELFGRRAMYNLPAALVENSLYKMAPRYGFKSRVDVNSADNWG